jgi:hypothetical protein
MRGQLRSSLLRVEKLHQALMQEAGSETEARETCLKILILWLGSYSLLPAYALEHEASPLFAA